MIPPKNHQQTPVFQPVGLLREARRQMQSLGRRLRQSGLNLIDGAVWTSDAPFRETQEAINHARQMGAVAVEMEAAALYALAQAQAQPIISFARATNQMATVDNDFERGSVNGNEDLMRLLGSVTQIWKEGLDENP